MAAVMPEILDPGVATKVDVDVYADCPQVWCDFSDGPARSLDGFCEHCGGQDHDCL